MKIKMKKKEKERKKKEKKMITAIKYLKFKIYMIFL